MFSSVLIIPAQRDTWGVELSLVKQAEAGMCGRRRPGNECDSPKVIAVNRV